jgi:hypothetical protein
MASSLSIDVFNSGYKPIPGGPGWDDSTPATWPASTSTLTSGDRDAVLAGQLSQSPAVPTLTNSQEFGLEGHPLLFGTIGGSDGLARDHDLQPQAVTDHILKAAQAVPGSHP